MSIPLPLFSKKIPENAKNRFTNRAACAKLIEEESDTAVSECASGLYRAERNRSEANSSEIRTHRNLNSSDRRIS